MLQQNIHLYNMLPTLESILRKVQGELQTIFQEELTITHSMFYMRLVHVI